jgi:transposase-like protein
MKFPVPEGDAWESFKQSIKETNGNAEDPIVYRVVNGERQGIDGRSREKACLELGIEPTYDEIDLADEEVVPFILRRNLYRRHLSAELRRQLVAELRTEGKSTRQIAETLGVGKSTVERDIKETRATVPNGTVEGRDGRARPATQTRAERVGQRPPTPFVIPESGRIEPGDDSPQIEEDDRREREEKAKEKALPKNGSPVFDWKGFESHMGYVIRGVGDLVRAYPAEKHSDEHRRCEQALSVLAWAVEDWRCRLVSGGPDKGPVFDASGHRIPDALSGVFVTAGRFKLAEECLGSVQDHIGDVARLPGGRQLQTGLACIQKGTEAAPRLVFRSRQLDDLNRLLRSTRPYSVCPYCKGERTPGCKGCVGEGWVSETTWTSIPDDIKARLS